MMKWFRKYNRHMMAGLVVFLMISFLIQDSLTRGSNDRQRAREFGHVRGQLIPADQIQSAAASRMVLDELHVPWRAPWLFLPGGMQSGLQQPLKPDEFTLLVLEAREMQPEVPQERVDQILNILKSAGMTSDAYINLVRQQRDLKMSDINAAVADFVRVVNTAESVLNGVHVSEDEIRHYVRDTSERANIAFV